MNDPLPEPNPRPEKQPEGLTQLTVSELLETNRRLNRRLGELTSQLAQLARSTSKINEVYVRTGAILQKQRTQQEDSTAWWRLRRLQTSFFLRLKFLFRPGL